MMSNICSLEELTPFTLSITGKPQELPRKLAEARHTELLSVLPERIAYIKEILERAGIIEDADKRLYFDRVGDWLASLGRQEDVRRFLTPGERGLEPTMDLDIPTVSACHYVGYLLASRLIDECPELSIVLCSDSKRNISYHQSIIRSIDGGSEMEPVRIAMNFVRSRLQPGWRLGTLGDLYDTWLSMLSEVG